MSESRKSVGGWYEDAFADAVAAAAHARGLSLHALGIYAINRAMAAAGRPERATASRRTYVRSIQARGRNVGVDTARTGKRMVKTSVEEDVAWATKELAAAARLSVEEWFRAVLEAEIAAGR